VDEGVRRNGGRTGAALGPEAIRRCLFKMTPDAENHDAFVHFLELAWDLGDLEPTGDLEADQATLANILAPHLSGGATVVVLGGGHETSFGHFLAHVAAGHSVQVLNWDAHPDVRPLVNSKGHSGSPFRQMMMHESRCCTGYVVAGINPWSAAKSHLKFLTEHGGRAVFKAAVTPGTVEQLVSSLRNNALVTFDLDALPQGVAPGVSAPNAEGLPPDYWLLAAELAGLNPAVRSIDVSELCPPHDRDDQTARFAALTIWRFWRGRSALGAGRQ
jgi:formiminoglutamase